MMQPSEIHEVLFNKKLSLSDEEEFSHSLLPELWDIVISCIPPHKLKNLSAVSKFFLERCRDIMWHSPMFYREITANDLRAIVDFKVPIRSVALNQFDIEDYSGVMFDDAPADDNKLRRITNILSCGFSNPVSLRITKLQQCLLTEQIDMMMLTVNVTEFNTNCLMYSNDVHGASGILEFLINSFGGTETEVVIDLELHYHLTALDYKEIGVSKLTYQGDTCRLFKKKLFQVHR